MGQIIILLIFLFHRKHTGPERLSYLLKNTQLVSGAAGILSHVCLIPEPLFFLLMFPIKFVFSIHSPRLCDNMTGFVKVDLLFLHAFPLWWSNFSFPFTTKIS
jgi:hypothetical protein